MYSNLARTNILLDMTFIVTWSWVPWNCGPNTLLFTSFAICHIIYHIHKIWCRASAIPTYVILSSSSIGNHIWLTCNKIITRVTFLAAWFVLLGNNVSQIMFILCGSPRSHKSLRFWQRLLATSMESSGKMLWRNGKFLIKCKWRLIIWDTLGLRGLKVDLNIALFSRDFYTFLRASCLGIEDTLSNSDFTSLATK